MSDSENAETKKRGRQSAILAEKRAPPKKDDKVPTADGETPAKRGRGRPKGSTKKNGGNKQSSKKSGGAKGRGKPTKKKDDSTEEEDNEETEENDEDNESGSDE